MLPIYYPMDGEKDERFEGVILLEGGEIEKKTAEDCGSFWHIRDWEVLESGGVNHWFCRSGYTLDKELIAKLAKVSNGQIKAGA